MKMAEHDWEVRSSRLSVRMLTLLVDVTVDVVNRGNQPPEFDELQFKLFDMAKAHKAKYHECREMVESCNQLLFSFIGVNADVALSVLDVLKEDLRTDQSPAAIQNEVYAMVDHVNGMSLANQVSAAVANFIQQFIDDTKDDIVYL